MFVGRACTPSSGKGSSIQTRFSNLPSLASTRPSERLELFARKLHACCTTFDYTDETSNCVEKELKLAFHKELIDFLETTENVLLHEPVYALSVVMISRNLFRVFPPTDPNYDPEEDDAIMDPAWSHLSLVYEYFLHLLESDNFQPSVAKKYFDIRFVTRFMQVFASEDFRELQMLKTILHRIYGKFLGLRATIRKQITNIFIGFLHGNTAFRGIAEILEMLGSVINGYACPLKSEHLDFLTRILIPLHKSKDLANFQPQLVYCIIQYMEKDPTTTLMIVKGLVRYWPKTCSSKEVLFLGELEELIDVMLPTEFNNTRNHILKQLTKCLISDHFQVAERAMYFWDNEYILSLVEVNAASIFPLILPALDKVSKNHWNPSISTLSSTVLKTFEDSKPNEYHEVMGSPEPISKKSKKVKGNTLWQKAAQLTKRK